MSAILREDALIWSIVLTTSDTTTPPRSATWLAFSASWLAWRVASAFMRTVSVSACIVAEVCSRLDAICSVRADRSLLPAATSLLDMAMLSALARTVDSERLSAPCIADKACASWPSSSRREVSISTVRSPSATRLAAPTMSVSGLTVLRVR